MLYSNYKTARDKAWKILINCKVDKLPVSTAALCEHYGWVLADYQEGKATIDLLGLSSLTERTDGFCTMTDHFTYIFYNSVLPVGRQRFTVAHEIGHLALGHVGRGRVTTINREPSPQDSQEETQANQFAVRLLAPACVLHELGATTPEAIQQVCGLSHQAAEFRAARMQELEKRNRYYTSPLERQVVEQFRSYVSLALRR